MMLHKKGGRDVFKECIQGMCTQRSGLTLPAWRNHDAHHIDVSDVSGICIAGHC